MKAWIAMHFLLKHFNFIKQRQAEKLEKRRKAAVKFQANVRINMWFIKLLKKFDVESRHRATIKAICVFNAVTFKDGLKNNAAHMIKAYVRKFSQKLQILSKIHRVR